jgi:hypothetical protein
MAISVGGWSNLEEALTGGYRIEYNHLYRVQEVADDSGAITTSGMTHDSFIRNNLIHHVKGGYFNDNVAIWFDNMSSGWTAENNIFYALDQGDMKLCAANLVDNQYRDNFVVAAPALPPEEIIEGEPMLTATRVQIQNQTPRQDGGFQTGQYIIVNATLKNVGSSGPTPVFPEGGSRRLQQNPRPAAARRTGTENGLAGNQDRASLMAHPLLPKPI